MKKKELIGIYEQKKKIWEKNYHKLSAAFKEKNIHSLRISTRRLRSFYSLLDYAGYQQNKTFRKKIKKLFSLLGQIRDYQINLIVLSNLYFVKSVPEDVAQRLSEQMAIKQQKLQKFLKKEGPSLEKMLEAEKQRIESFLEEISKKDLNYFLNDLALYYEQTFDEHLHNHGNDLESLHELRLVVKKYRYFLENFGSFLPEDERIMIRQLKTMQEFLGEINDLDVLLHNIDDLQIELTDYKKEAAIARLHNKVKEFTINF